MTAITQDTAGQLTLEVTDDELAAWRRSAGTGRLPLPVRTDRWQVLRAGVVNLWEFDVAEYWFADGRTQFVGQNQTGKSTLMALTTLIMVAGTLDRTFVDTFGEQHKAFRYYVEPTGDPTDRRASDTATNRGWAWVEYGRVTAGVPEYFTALLYAQSQRGKSALTTRWATCEGAARVGQQLALHQGASTNQPGDLTDVPGFSVATSGHDYKSRLATGLFDFSDPDRLDAVVRMLKVLRTPHLGQKLDPNFFTAQMREALPAVAKNEIDELAEGWDQLDKLASDQERTEEAEVAVQGYVRKAWAPWADTVLRRAADDLVAATTAVDNVTREERASVTAATAAQAAHKLLAGDLDQTKADHSVVDEQYEAFRRTPAFMTAVEGRNNAKQLHRAAIEKDQTATAVEDAAAAAAAHVTTTENTAKNSRNTHSARASDVSTAAERVLGAVSAAGLDPACVAATEAADVARLRAAIGQRSGHLRDAHKLLRAADLATTNEASAIERAASFERAAQERAAAFTEAQDTLTDAMGHLSDDLERWATKVDHDAPTTQLRTAWIDKVTDTSTGPKPHGLLGDLVTREWLMPLTSPLSADAVRLRRDASDARDQADKLGVKADQRAAQRDPVPNDPTRWTRRDRADQANGAALWRLLDPVDGLERDTLDRLEAALDAAGLLDAWVTPDGTYRRDRDGHETVVVPVGGPTGSHRTLRTVLQPAADAGDCAETVDSFLASVAYVPDGHLAGSTSFAADGRWADAGRAGHAAPAAHGAELLGTAARAAARDRQVAELRAQAQVLRTDAEVATNEAEQLEGAIGALTAAAASAPSDAVVVTNAHAALSAEGEFARASKMLEPARKAAVDAAALAADARTDLLNFTATHRLPHDHGTLTTVETALEAAGAAVGDWNVALAKLAAAQETLDVTAQALVAAHNHHRSVRAQADRARLAATAAQAAAADAKSRLGRSDTELIEREQELRHKVRELAERITTLTGEVATQKGLVELAEVTSATTAERRAAAVTARDEAVERWWVPVDHGLATRRGLPDAAGRLATHALAQARAARETLSPTNWPDRAADRDGKVAQALTKMSGGSEMTSLRQVLEAGGRTVTMVESDAPGALPVVQVTVDTSGTQVDPVEAVVLLRRQATRLAELHDEKIQQVLVELLSSTFVEHLRERLSSVVGLLDKVNTVLKAHPTGANDTTLRLRRVPNAGQRDAFSVLEALERGAVDAPAVQEHVRAFLKAQIDTAQDLGRGGLRDWKEHLADQLDYRRWFDVITEVRVGDSAFRPLTRELHAKDSGGGKVITLLQPLLATLVALYNESPTAPRPLWLDEAFTGVDDDNRATMLGMLTTFDLDFLLAGPTALVTVAQVPAASVWFISRAPAPTPGVDLSLMVWAGQALTEVPLPTPNLTVAAAPQDDDGYLDFSASPTS